MVVTCEPVSSYQSPITPATLACAVQFAPTNPLGKSDLCGLICAWAVSTLKDLGLSDLTSVPICPATGTAVSLTVHQDCRSSSPTHSVSW